ncbi:hypothetical protein HDV05_005875 [Chytridiales sp. JEL 0842]|nr:hypothetical protein HDV05_005875 [Chytridiales sp. JEL 0842]
MHSTSRTARIAVANGLRARRSARLPWNRRSGLYDRIPSLEPWYRGPLICYSTSSDPPPSRDDPVTSKDSKRKPSSLPPSEGTLPSEHTAEERDRVNTMAIDAENNAKAASNFYSGGLPPGMEVVEKQGAPTADKRSTATKSTRQTKGKQASSKKSGKNEPSENINASFKIVGGKLTLQALLDQNISESYLSKLPSVSSGIILLSMPMKGSDIYLEQLIKSFCAHEPNTYFLRISNDDLFPRMTGHEVITSPPLKKSSNMYSSPLNPFGGGRQPGNPFNGRGRAVSIGPNSLQMAPVGIVMEGRMVVDQDENDQPDVPYPWHKSYTNSRGVMSLMSNRIPDPDKSISDADELVANTFRTFFKTVTQIAEGRRVIIYYEDLMSLIESEEHEPADIISCLNSCLSTARKFAPIVLVVPNTPTFKTSTAGRNKPMNGLSALLQGFQGSSEDMQDDIPDGMPPSPFGSSKNAKKINPLKYDSCLDDFIGINFVNVLPPIDQSISDMDSFRNLMKRDAKKLYREANLREIKFIADYLNLEIDFGDKATLRALCEIPADIIDNQISSLFHRKSQKYHPLDSHLLTPMQIESLLMFYTASKKEKGSVVDAIDTASKALASGIATAAAMESGAGSLNQLPMFKNPQDAIELTKHETRILEQCLVKPGNLKTSFANIGGLEKTKRTINELIRLPLLQPEIFSFGILKQSTTGILLFGPPGTGKTMLARAVASESGANFLNIQMSNVQSMWVGENEKLVKAVFSLARKLRPCVIFVDEIDALLKIRGRHQPTYVTNTINEWMQEWDGIQAEASNGIIVVGATNRPFDLDDAVLRRLPRRIFVNLPSMEERVEILNVLLKDETLGTTRDHVDEAARKEVIADLAERTEGFSGSDLKNLCIGAALNAVRASMESGQPFDPKSRIVTTAHFVKAIESGDVVPSLNDRGELLKLLKQWDKEYGTGYSKGGMTWGF